MSLYYYCNQERYMVKRKERVWGQWSRTQSVVRVRVSSASLQRTPASPPLLVKPGR